MLLSFTGFCCCCFQVSMQVQRGEWVPVALWLLGSWLYCSLSSCFPILHFKAIYKDSHQECPCYCVKGALGRTRWPIKMYETSITKSESRGNLPGFRFCYELKLGLGLQTLWPNLEHFWGKLWWHFGFKLGRMSRNQMKLGNLGWVLLSVCGFVKKNWK